MKKQFLINPFVPNAFFLCLLKTSENHKVFLYFQEVKKVENWKLKIENKWVHIARTMK